MKCLQLYNFCVYVCIFHFNYLFLFFFYYFCVVGWVCVEAQFIVDPVSVSVNVSVDAMNSFYCDLIVHVCALCFGIDEHVIVDLILYHQHSSDSYRILNSNCHHSHVHFGQTVLSHFFVVQPFSVANNCNIGNEKRFSIRLN